MAKRRLPMIAAGYIIKHKKGGDASLRLTAVQFASGTSAGAILASIIGAFPGGTTTLLADGFGGRVSVDSTNKLLKAATTLTAGSGTIKLRDVSADGTQANERTFSLKAVTASVVPALGALALSNASFTAGAAAGTVIGSITGKTAGSTIAVTPNDGRLAVSSDGSQLLVGVSASSAGTINATLTETLAGANGSPKDTAVSVVVGAAAPSFTRPPAPSGYVTSYTDDFSGPLDIVTPAKPAGKYVPTRVYGNNGARAAVGGLSLKMYDVDPFHTGFNDKNRGVALPSFADAMVQSGGRLNLKARAASAGEQSNFNPQLPQVNIGSMIATPQAIVAMLPCVFEVTFSLTKNQAVRGWHPTINWLMQMGSPRSDNDLEMDWEGTSLAVYANQQDWASGIATAQATNNQNPLPHVDGVTRTYRLEVTATQRKFYYKNLGDADFTLYLTTDKAPAQPGKPFYLLSTCHIADFTEDPYMVGDWAAGGVGVASIEDYAVHRSAAGAHYAPTTPAVGYSTPAGTAFSFTLPSAASVWGSAVSEVVEAFNVESNEPGGGGYNLASGYSGFPSGITYNAGTGVLSGTLTKPGTLHIVRYVVEAGSSCEPQRIALHVGPRVQWLTATFNSGGSFDLYPILDCGQLTSDASGARAKTISVTPPAGMSYANDVLTSTTPGLYSVPVTVTNSQGQSVSVTVIVRVTTPNAPFFVQDSFTEASTVSLGAHVGELGAAWRYQDGGSYSSVSGAGRLFGTAVGQAVYADTPPPSADYYVEAVISFLTLVSGDRAAVAGRMTGTGNLQGASGNAMYFFGYGETAGGWQLFKVVNGSATQIGTTVTATRPTTDTTLRLTMQGSTISGSVNGAQVISVTDTSVTAAGYAGLRPGAIVTSTTGQQVNSFAAATL